MPSAYVDPRFHKHRTALLDSDPTVERTCGHVKIVANCSLFVGVSYAIGATVSAIGLLPGYSVAEFLCVALPFLAVYVGLIRLWPAARWTAMILACVLIFIPFSWYVLWAFTRPAAKKIFSRQLTVKGRPC